MLKSKNSILFVLVLIGILLFSIFGCDKEVQRNIDREAKIPLDAVKQGITSDENPPILHSDEYEQPIPLANSINTAGAEDSPFIPYDKKELYFFFAPDVSVPVEKQVLDQSVGIYRSKYVGGEWLLPERVFLQKEGKLALDGCEYVNKDYMLFCSAREGYTGVHWFFARLLGDNWVDWKNADEVVRTEDFSTGELHIWDDELYFHSDRSGGKGGTDLWLSKRIGGEWGEPDNIAVVNTEENEGMPYITKDGTELWFNRQYKGTPGIFRSKRVGADWGEPELIISRFAGEPTLDSEGNIYFVHHYFKDGVMIEADIYVAYRK